MVIAGFVRYCYARLTPTNRKISRRICSTRVLMKCSPLYKGPLVARAFLYPLDTTMPCHARPESHTLPAVTLELSRHMIRAISSHPLLEFASRLRQAVQLSNSSHPCSPHTPRESAVEELPAHWTSNIPELKSKWIRLPLEYLFNILCTLATGYPTLKHTWRAYPKARKTSTNTRT